MVIIRNEEGLTLVETIIALVMVVVLAAAFAGSMSIALQREVEVDNRLDASNLASSIIDLIGEGENLKEILSDDSDNLKSEIELFIKNDDNDNYKLIDEDDNIILDNELDSELIFSGLRLDDNDDVTKITINEYKTNLYKVIVEVFWFDRSEIHQENIATLLAVDWYEKN